MSKIKIFIPLAFLLFLWSQCSEKTPEDTSDFDSIQFEQVDEERPAEPEPQVEVTAVEEEREVITERPQKASPHPTELNCRKAVPQSFNEFCTEIHSQLAVQCLKYLLDRGFGLSVSSFERCSAIRQGGALTCLKSLESANIEGCLSVSTKNQIECLRIAGFGHKEECLHIDTLSGVACIQLLDERRWRHLFEFCPLVTETDEISCLKGAANPTQAMPCFPAKRLRSFAQCRTQSPVTIEAGKRVIVKVEGDVNLAGGSLSLNIKPDVKALKPIKIFRANEIRGRFDRIIGQRKFGIIYHDKSIELVASEEGSFVRDRRSEKLRGRLEWEEVKKICEELSRARSKMKNEKLNRYQPGKRKKKRN